MPEEPPEEIDSDDKSVTGAELAATKTLENSFNEDSKQMNKFNFSGLSFKDYVKAIQLELNDEMRRIVNLFITQK